MASPIEFEVSTPIPGTRWHELALVLLATIVITWPLQRGGGDVWLADQLFRLQGGAWHARYTWWASGLLHEGGRDFCILMFLVLLGIWIASARRAALAPWRIPLGYLLTALLTATVLLFVSKRFSGVDCPWDLARYTGTRLYLPPFSGHAAAVPPGTCFPAAHAGVGYAWLALWFALRPIRPHWRKPALLMTLGLGLVFGFVQQLRGAHFLSHDLWSLALCWLVAATLARFWRWDASPAARGREPGCDCDAEPAR